MNRPALAETAKRLGAASGKDALAYVFKTGHLQHGGKLSLARLLAGHLDDGATLAVLIGRGRPGVRDISAELRHDTKRPAAEAAIRSPSASSTPSRPAIRSQAARPRHPPWCMSSRLPPVLAIADRGNGPQGRRQARPGLVAAQ